MENIIKGNFTKKNNNNAKIAMLVLKMTQKLKLIIKYAKNVIYAYVKNA